MKVTRLNGTKMSFPSVLHLLTKRAQARTCDEGAILTSLDSDSRNVIWKYPGAGRAV